MNKLLEVIKREVQSAPLMYATLALGFIITWAVQLGVTFV